MANKIYIAPETTVRWDAAGTTKVLTFTSLANGAGRIGAQLDRGAGSVPGLYQWKMKVKAAAALTVGTLFNLYISTSDGTDVDGNLGTADAAVASLDKMRNLAGAGAIMADSTTNGEVQISRGFVWITERYFSPVVWNALGQALTGTGGDHYVDFTPVPPEVQ